MSEGGNDHVEADDTGNVLNCSCRTTCYLTYLYVTDRSLQAEKRNSLVVKLP